MNELDEKWALEFARRRALEHGGGDGNLDGVIAGGSEDRIWQEWGATLESRFEETLGKVHHALLRSRIGARAEEATLVAVLRLAESAERQENAEGLSMTLVPPSLDPSSGFVARESHELEPDKGKLGKR